MFKKSTKATIHFRHNAEGYSTSSNSVPLNDGKLIEYLRETHKRYGDLIIEYISEDGEIELSTKRSAQHENQEDRIAEIGDVIRDYVKNRAIDMEAHAVFVDGQLKGVFGNESHAELKRKNLISRGATADSVTVETIQVNSFQDFQ